MYINTMLMSKLFTTHGSLDCTEQKLWWIFILYSENQYIAAEKMAAISQMILFNEFSCVQNLYSLIWILRKYVQINVENRWIWSTPSLWNELMINKQRLQRLAQGCLDCTVRLHLQILPLSHGVMWRDCFPLVTHNNHYDVTARLISLHFSNQN